MRSIKNINYLFRRKKLLNKQAISLSYLYGGKWIGFSDQTNLLWTA